eukprot:2327418-Pyramimonas_sp.AAC.1
MRSQAGLLAGSARRAQFGRSSKRLAPRTLPVLAHVSDSWMELPNMSDKDQVNVCKSLGAWRRIY